MSRKSRVIPKPYRVVFESSHVPTAGEVGRYRSLKEAQRFALSLVTDLMASVQERALNIAWVRARVYCGPHLILTFEPLTVE